MTRILEVAAFMRHYKEEGGPKTEIEVYTKSHQSRRKDRMMPLERTAAPALALMLTGSSRSEALAVKTKWMVATMRALKNEGGGVESR